MKLDIPGGETDREVADAGADGATDGPISISRVPQLFRLPWRRYPRTRFADRRSLGDLLSLRL